MVAGRQRFLVILNPTSGTAAERLTVVRDFFSGDEVNAQLCELDESVDVTERIKSAAPDVDVVVVAGGDGTVNAAAPGLVETGKPLAVIPCGTANDLARTLGVPNDPAQACRLAMHGVARTICLGKVNGRLFFNASHLGLGVDALKNSERHSKQEWGVMAYLHGMADVLQEHRVMKVRIRLDGGEWRSLSSLEVAVGNGKHYGGGMTMSEDAELADKSLHVYSVDPQNALDLVRKAPAFFNGTLDRYKNIFTASATEVDIETDGTEDISVDGELATTTPASFSLVPDAVQVIGPGKDSKGNAV